MFNYYLIKGGDRSSNVVKGNDNVFILRRAVIFVLKLFIIINHVITFFQQLSLNNKTQTIESLTSSTKDTLSDHLQLRIRSKESS